MGGSWKWVVQIVIIFRGEWETNSLRSIVTLVIDSETPSPPSLPRPALILLSKAHLYMRNRSKCSHSGHLQGDLIGCLAGNGGKVSNSLFHGLIWLCLAAA